MATFESNSGVYIKAKEPTTSPRGGHGEELTEEAKEKEDMQHTVPAAPVVEPGARPLGSMDSSFSLALSDATVSSILSGRGHSRQHSNSLSGHVRRQPSSSSLQEELVVRMNSLRDTRTTAPPVKQRAGQGPDKDMLSALSQALQNRRLNINDAVAAHHSENEWSSSDSDSDLEEQA